MIPHLAEPDSEIETLRQRIAALEDQVFGRLDVNRTQQHVPIHFGGGVVRPGPFDLEIHYPLVMRHQSVHGGSGSASQLVRD